MFDAMLTFFVALGMLGLVLAWQGRQLSVGVSAVAVLASRPMSRGFALFAIGLAGALYAKGPVALLHLLPLALAAPWWMREQQPDWRRWYGGVALAVALAAALILAWALPAASAGGAQYRDAILWGQTAGRMADSFAHVAPWWYYLAWLPLLFAPWLLLLTRH